MSLAAGAAGLIFCARSPSPGLRVLEQHRGQVLVLLLGMEGCSGTERATPMLAEFDRAKPAGVVVYRIDVPPPGRRIRPASNLPAGLNYAVDRDRALAMRLEFFFYPTFFILDREGEVRFSGGCEAASLRRMTEEILAEPRGSEKRFYTPQLARVGQLVPDMTVRTIAGAEVALHDLCDTNGVFVYFASSGCPFSREGLAAMEVVKQRFKASGLRFVAVGFGDTADECSSRLYGHSPGMVFLEDPEKILGGQFGVTGVPVFFILDKDLRVKERHPFTPDAATMALSHALGVPPGPRPPRIRNTGAG